MYESRAKKIAEEHAAKQQEAERVFNESLSQQQHHQQQSPWGELGKMSPAVSGPRPATPAQGMFHQHFLIKILCLQVSEIQWLKSPTCVQFKSLACIFFSYMYLLLIECQCLNKIKKKNCMVH